jgi:hypothetical protein
VSPSSRLRAIVPSPFRHRSNRASRRRFWTAILIGGGKGCRQLSPGRHNSAFTHGNLRIAGDPGAEHLIATLKGG